jgi:voltage-gated potassium channel
MAEMWRRLLAPWTRLEQRWEALLRPLERRLRLHLWFPHGPLALIVALLGVLLLDAMARSTTGVSLASVRGAHVMERIQDIRLATTHEFAIGLLLIVMSVGLLARSRFAWVWTTAGLTLALAIRVFVQSRQVDVVLLSSLAVLFALVAARRHFTRRSLVTAACLGLYAVVTYHAYATLATLQLGDHFDPPIREPISALYFVLVTISTIGYGDITAQSQQAQMFVMGLLVTGLILVATVVSTFLLPLLTSRMAAHLSNRGIIVDRTKHYVIVGGSSLARNTAEELEKRGQHVTFVLETSTDQAFYAKRDLVVGDAADLSVLREAGADTARGVLALSTDDAMNGFVVLGVNELAPNVPSVAALNDPKNQFRLKRTQPSLLLSLQVLGGELLAKALTGEQVTAEILEKVLQIHTQADDDASA